MRRRPPSIAAALLGLALLASAGGVSEATNVHCGGDSITAGRQPFDEEGKGGYPGRLKALLRQGGIEDADIENFGVGGDDTFDLLGRIGEIVKGADILVLLGGTNDIDDIIRGSITLDDTIDNLQIMLDFAEDSGVRVIVGTLIPRRPGARRDGRNSTTYEVIQEIRLLAHRERYEVADFWHLFPNRQRSTYALFYYPGKEDLIGHPNAAGFEKMAELVAGVILDGDNQSPVDGRLREPDSSVSQVNAESDYELELYDFDSGIQLSSATLLLNGEPVETKVTGNRRKAVLFAEGDGRRRCKVILSVRASDRAEPPNELDFFVSRFSTPQRLIEGDVNGDCRVDGRDLALFGPGFGKSRTDLGFNEELDFVTNGAIDGDDLARLAFHFGRGQLAGGGE